MNRDYIEEFTGELVKITLVDGNTFEGTLWFVCFEDEREIEVYSINLSNYDFDFLVEDIVSIEKIGV